VATDSPILAGMAGRYARALFELALEAGQLGQVDGELQSIKALLAESADLQRLVRSPVFSATEQANAIGAVLQKAGASRLTANFFAVIARNGRLFATEDMVTAFSATLANHRGEVTASVTSATALDDQQLTQLKDALKAEVGKDVQIEMSVEPALLAGLVVKIGSKMIDSSLRTKLNGLKTAMKEVG
jgi:F-type H+-transporting ATPase subunit delta